MVMKLTNEDKELILDWGHSEDDFWQIEEAMKKKYTTYELTGADARVITREEAIEILGREEYLSGICRSAFHFSAFREGYGGREVYFDSSELFKN